MIKINYKSDFKINESSETVAMEVPFVFSYYVFDSKKYVVSFDGHNYVNCERKEDGSLDVIFNKPEFGIGHLKVERKYAVDDKAFADGVFDVVTVDKTDVFITSGKTFENYVKTLVVPPYLKGDKGDPMTWSTMTETERKELVHDVAEAIDPEMVMTENEKSRQEAERSRQTAEQQRSTTFNTLKGEMQSAITAGNAAAGNAQKVVDEYDTKVDEQDSKLTELGSEVFNVKSAISYTEEKTSIDGTVSIGYVNPDSHKIQFLTSGTRSIWYAKTVRGNVYSIDVPKTTDFGLVVAFSDKVESGVVVGNYVDIENGIHYSGDIESPINGYIIISYITSNGEPSVKQTIINSSVKKLESLIGLDDKLYSKKESVAYSNEIDQQGDTLYSYQNIGLIHKGATNGKFRYIDLMFNYSSSDGSEVGSLIVERGESVSANGGTVVKQIDNFSNESFPESGFYTIELDEPIELADSEYLWVYYTGRVVIGAWAGNNSDGTRIGIYFKGNINTYRYSSSMKLYDKKGDIISLQEKVEELEKQQGGSNNNILRDVEYEILREYVMNNYGLFVSLIDGYNYIEGVLTVDGNMTSTSIVPLDKKSDICIGSSGYSYIVFFDKDFKHVETKKVTQYVVVHFNEFPSNAEYVAFSYLNKDSMNAGVFCTINTNKYTTYMYSKTKKKRGTRPVINIYLSDSESEIFEKLVDALLTRDCDVIFEKGEYTFSQIYIDMADVYRFGKIQGSYQRELPLGGNCHYYLNGSVITGIKPESISDCKVFGTIRTGGEDYCIQDGTIISDGMVYCIHDEGQGNELFHRHEYKFLSMKMTNGGTRPFGAGIGNGEIIIDRCIIENNSNDITDVAVHGVTSETEVKFNPLVSITNCYLKNGAQINVASENQKGMVLYSSNSSTKAVNVTDWELYAWNNEVRN